MIGLTSRFAALGRTSSKPLQRDADAWSRPRLPWPMPVLPGLLIAGVITFGWWRMSLAQLSDAGGPPGGAAFAASFAILARIVGNAIEAAWYVLAWRSFGRRLPFVRMFAWIVLLSGFDLLAWETRQRYVGAQGWVPAMVAAIAGLGALPGSWLPRAFHVAFASAGLLTLIRILLTARAQSLGTGVSLVRAFALTLATWFVTHLALAFGYGLMQGRSLPGMP